MTQKKFSNIVLPAILVATFMLFSGCTQQSKEDGTTSLSSSTETIAVVPESERVVPEGTIEVTYPKYLVDATGGSLSEFVEGNSPEEVEARGGDDNYSGMYANSDGTATVYLTEEQRTMQEERSLELVETLVEAYAQEDVQIEVADDYMQVVVTVGPEATSTNVRAAMFDVSVYAASVQVMRTQGEDFSITVEAVDASTGEVMESFDQDTYSTWSSDLSWVGGPNE